MKKIVTLTINPAIDKTLTVEEFVPGGTNRIVSKAIHLGGKGINVARVARSFGEPVYALGFATEEFKKLLLPELAEQGIESDFIHLPGETRTNIKIQDCKAGNITELNDRGFGVSLSHISALTQKIEKLLPETELLILTGSLPEGVPADFYASMIRLCNKQGVKVILDADGEAFRLGVAEKPYAVKPNLDELIRYAGRPLDTEEKIMDAMAQLIHSGIALVVVSRGAKGACFMDGKKKLFVPSLPVMVKSTVGAGDSMVASMAYSVLYGKNLEETAKLSVAAGSVTASKEGTGLCTGAEVLEKSREVRIEAWLCE